MEPDQLLELGECLISCTRLVAIIGSLLQLQEQDTQGSSRRWWIRPSNQIREQSGFFETTFWQLYVHDHEKFKSWCRLTPSQFDFVVHKVRPMLEKEIRREPLTVEERVAITLQHLAQGTSPTELGLQFCRGRSTVSALIPEVSKVIWNVLQPLYLKAPEKPSEWRKISRRFFSQWQLPNCLGCVDGKHINIKAPAKSGTLYFNHKKTFSIQLMAVCDADYIFTLVDVGAYGSNADSTVFQQSAFGRAFMQQTVNTPPPEPLPNSNVVFDFYLAGDNGFPLLNNLLTPFSRRNKDYNLIEHHIFNYRLIRGRRVIENCFGIFVTEFQLFNETLQWTPEVAEDVVKAALCLYNMIRIDLRMDNDEDVAGDEQAEAASFFQPGAEPRNATNGSANRKTLMDWCLSEAGEFTPQYDILNAREIQEQTMEEQVLQAMDRELN